MNCEGSETRNEKATRIIKNMLRINGESSTRTSISSEGYESRTSISSFSLSAPASRTSSIGSYDANEKWIGELLPQVYINPQFSKRIFLGSNDSIDVDGVRAFLEAFGPCEFPIHGHEKFGRHVYCRFEDSRSVKALVMHCDMHREQIYLPFPARNSRIVQVIPFVVSDSHYRHPASDFVEYEPPNEQNTIFIGALHGRLTAKAIAEIFSAKFGPVRQVDLVLDGIDNYPVGSGTVTFFSPESVIKAQNAETLDVITSCFSKRIHIDPCIRRGACFKCPLAYGQVFCRSPECYNYMCLQCAKEHFKNGHHENMGIMVDSMLKPHSVIRPHRTFSQSCSI